MFPGKKSLPLKKKKEKKNLISGPKTSQREMTNQRTGTESQINLTDTVKSLRKFKINRTKETDMRVRERSKKGPRRITNPREVSHGQISRTTIGEGRTNMRSPKSRKEGSVVAVVKGIEVIRKKVAERKG